MKIIKPINVTDAILIDSSIPMPDTERGEEEWLGESARTFQTSSITIPHGTLVDVLYIDNQMAANGVWMLHGNRGQGYNLTHFSNAGVQVRSVSIPRTPPSGGTYDVISLSLVSDSVIYIGMALWNSSGWDLHYVTYDIINFQLSTARIAFPSNRYKNSGSLSDFRIKTNGSQHVVRAAITEGSGYGITKLELTVFNSEGSLTGSAGQSFADACITNSEIFALAQLPVSSGGVFKTRVTVFNYNMSIKEQIDFPSIPGNYTAPRINFAMGKVSHSTQWSGEQVLTRAYNQRMINIGAYQRNDEVIKSLTKRKYRCAVDATFDDPELGVNLSPPSWVDIGAVNRWKAFDKQPAQQAVSDDPMYYKLKPGDFIRALSIFNISSANSIDVKVTDPSGGVVYDSDFDLVDNSNVVDMWTYLTLPISFKKELIITDLVCFRDSEIEITVHGTQPAVGAIVVGNGYPAGRCVTGTGVRSNQFSIRKENGFGGFDIIQRGVGKIVRFRVAYDISQIEYLTNLLESIDSVYCVFIGDLPNGKTISVYGVLDPYQSDFETPTVNTLEFDVLGVL
jgi:hypothetical protein